VPSSAVALVCASTLCFAVLDAMFKFLSQIYPIAVLVWARWTVQALVLLAWLARARAMRWFAPASSPRTCSVV